MNRNLTILKQAVSRISIFNYLLLLILAAGVVVDGKYVHDKINTDSLILLASMLIISLLYTLIAKVSNNTSILTVTSYLVFVANIYFVFKITEVSGSLYSIFYLMLVPVIELRHFLKKTGMLVAGVAITATYLYSLSLGTNFNATTWIEAIFVFLLFLGYIITSVSNILVSEIQQYQNQNKMEEVNQRIQNEKEIMSLMYKNIRELSNSLDMEFIASQVNEFLSTIVWNKSFILVTVSPNNSGELQCFKFIDGQGMTSELTDNESNYIKQTMASKEIVYQSDVCGIQLNSGTETIGAILLFDFPAQVVIEKIQFLYAICEQVAVILNNALKYYKKELESITDGMTGLYNNKYFKQVLEQMMVQGPENLYLIIYDIDKFKNFNDTYGHQFGDKVLIETGKAVSRVLRDNDFFARYGGEEFAIIFEAPSDDIAQRIAERIRKAVESNNIYNDDLAKEVSVTVSVGVGKYNTEWSKTDYIEIVDSALYTCKDKGRNCVTMVGYEELRKKEKKG